ncbi:MAG: hypothetical protein GY903_11720 [Fuerstiella sp.]|nr:hypothetical protein [Fuerstiella sp.]
MSCATLASAAQPDVAPTLELSGEQLRDRIRGGLLGQMLGNLNGLKHEMKYIPETALTSYLIRVLHVNEQLAPIQALSIDSE